MSAGVDAACVDVAWVAPVLVRTAGDAPVILLKSMFHHDGTIAVVVSDMARVYGALLSPQQAAESVAHTELEGPAAAKLELVRSFLMKGAPAPGTRDLAFSVARRPVDADVLRLSVNARVDVSQFSWSVALHVASDTVAARFTWSQLVQPLLTLAGFNTVASWGALPDAASAGSRASLTAPVLLVGCVPSAAPSASASLDVLVGGGSSARAAGSSLASTVPLLPSASPPPAGPVGAVVAALDGDPVYQHDGGHDEHTVTDVAREMELKQAKKTSKPKRRAFA